MAELRMFPNGRETDEARMARLEAHIFHLWQQQNGLKDEIHELKKDRAALIRRIGGWAVWALAALLGAIVSKGSTLGFLVHAFLSTTAP